MVLLTLGFLCHIKAATVQVTWNANTETDLAGYKVYHGTSSRAYTVIMDVGGVTQYTVDGLNIGTSYYFAVTAYDASGNESGYSQEVVYRVEDITPPTATAAAEQSDKIKVIFSEPVEKTSAELVSNYSLNKGIVVQRAELQADLKTVYLFTTTMVNAWYALTINNVKDRGSIPNSIGSNTVCEFPWEGGDAAPPTLVSVDPTRNDFLTVTFSEALNQSTAQAAANYAISPSVTITQAGIDAGCKVVYLTTASHTPGTTYTLSVSNVKDVAGNAISANSQKTYTVVSTTPPVPIAARIQDATHLEVEFNVPVDLTTAQRTGNYAISSSVSIQSSVLSTDKRKATLTTSAHTVTGNYTVTINGIADATTTTTVMTVPVQLTYPFTVPDTQAPRLESVALTSVNYLQVTFNEPVERTSALAAGNYAITPSVAVISVTLDVSQKMVLIQTANHPSGSYTLRASNVKDQASTPNTIDPNYATKTYTYSAPDQTPPQLVRAILRGANLVELVFNEALDRTGSETTANYSIDKNIAVQGASLTGDSLNHVNLTTTSHTPGLSYTVTAKSIKDRAANPNAIISPQALVYDYPYVDKTPPKMTAVTPTGDQMLELVFDEYLDQASAQTITNYTIAPPVQIKSATLTANQNKIILNTAPHQSGVTYTVVASGVKDMANPANAVAAPNNQGSYFIVGQDKTPPELRFAELLNDRTLRITFNEPLDPVTAGTIGNYSADNGIAVQKANVSPTLMEVSLTTTPHPRGTFTVTVRNLKDQAATPNAMTAEVQKSYSWQPVDNSPPVLKEQPKLVGTQTIELVFDESLNPASIVPANFTISNGITVDKAVLLIDGLRVHLTTSTHVPGNYTVAIKDVQDASGNAISAIPVTGTYAYSIQDKNPPSLQSAELRSKNRLVAKFSEPVDKTSGGTKTNYRINNNIEVLNAIVSSWDNEVELETSDHMAGEYALTVNGVSDLSKNAIQSYVQVKYSYNPPDTSAPRLLSAMLVYNNCVVLKFSEALDETSAKTLANYKIDPSVTLYQAILDASFSQVTMVTATHPSGIYKITASNIKDRAFQPNTIKTSFATAQYSYISADTLAPVLEALELTTPSSLSLKFSEPVSRETAENLANYAIDNGIRITNAYLTSDLNKVILETTVHQARVQYTMAVSGIKDRAPNPNMLKKVVQKTYSFAPADDVPPQLQAVKLQNPNILELVFSEALEQASAEKTANYSIDPNVEVLNATLDPAQSRKVLLETSMHIPAFQYGVYVRNIKDVAASPNVITPNPTYMSYTLPVGQGQSVENDNVAPSVAKVNVISQTQMEVYFTETVDKATAENKANYAIQDSVSVQSIKLDTSLAKVLLTTTSHRSGKTYRIQIANVKDRAKRGNVLAAGEAVQYIYCKGLSVSNPNRSGYTLQIACAGKTCYGDRAGWTLRQIPDVLNGAVMVQTLNGDKASTEDEFLKLETKGAAAMFVAYDKRIASVPAWLSGWKATGEQVVDSRSNVYAVYTKNSLGGRLVLGGNHGTTEDNMYMVFAAPQSGNAALVAGMSKSAYAVAQVGVGDTYYIDRPYTISSIPDSLKGLIWIKTAKEDNTKTDSEFLRISLTECTRVYLAVDPRMSPLPAWMSAWTQEKVQIVDSRGDKFDVLSKVCDAGDVVLGGNGGYPEDNMYVVLLKPAGGIDRGLSEQPGYFTLYQNYPNPFNPKTVIPYKVHKNGRLKISVFNVLGQTVKVLIDGNFAAGYQDEIVWDATDQKGLPVASGLYFYRIEQEQFAKTRRMMLLR